MKEEILLEMLDIALGYMNENEACCYCRLYSSVDCHLGNTDEYCKDMLFEGLKSLAQKRLKENEQCA